MGAWGYKTFEDDSSLNLIDEWIQSPSPLDRIKFSLTQAIEQDEFDCEAGQVIATSVAVLKFALSPSTAPDLEEQKEIIDGLSEWLLTMDPVKLADLLPQAIQGLDRLISPESELYELWEENDELHPKCRQSSYPGRERDTIVVIRPHTAMRIMWQSHISDQDHDRAARTGM